jgi:hypothetical protein
METTSLFFDEKNDVTRFEFIFAIVPLNVKFGLSVQIGYIQAIGSHPFPKLDTEHRDGVVSYDEDR